MGAGVVTVCPNGHALEGLARFCWACGEYVDRIGPRQDEPLSHPPVTDGRVEKEVQSAVCSLLRSLGYHVSDMSQDRPTRQTEGIPDLYVMGHGRATWAEMKRPSKRGAKDGGLSPAQIEWHRVSRENGVNVQVWYDETDALRWHEGTE